MKMVVFLSKILLVMAFTYLFLLSGSAQNHPLQSGIYSIKVLESGLYLDATSSTDGQYGDKVQLWTKSDTDSTNQRWFIDLQPNGSYRISVESTGKCLSVAAPGDFINGSKLQLSKCFYNHQNQTWKIVNVGPSEYVIKANETNLCVEANGNPNYSGKQKPGALVDLWNYVGVESQNEIWIFKKLKSVSKFD